MGIMPSPIESINTDCPVKATQKEAGFQCDLVYMCWMIPLWKNF